MQIEKQPNTEQVGVGYNLFGGGGGGERDP